MKSRKLEEMVVSGAICWACDRMEGSEYIRHKPYFFAILHNVNGIVSIPEGASLIYVLKEFLLIIIM